MNLSWEFKKPNKHGSPTVEITVELRDEEDVLGAYAEDSYYYGDLPKEHALDLARAVLAKFGTSFPIGTFVRVIDGALTGSDGFVVGTLIDGDVVVQLDEWSGILPAKFLRKA